MVAIDETRRTEHPCCGVHCTHDRSITGDRHCLGQYLRVSCSGSPLANIRRRPERFVLSVLGIALAIACVIVVRTISSSFAITGADSVTDVLGGAQLWAVPAAGVHYNPDVQALVADGPAPELTLPAGWTGGLTLSGCHHRERERRCRMRGNDQIPSGPSRFRLRTRGTARPDQGCDGRRSAGRT